MARLGALILKPGSLLPPNVPVGGFICACNSQNTQIALQRRVFGWPYPFQSSIEAIRPGLTLFLYDYQTEKLHGIFEATSSGGILLDPEAWPVNNDTRRSILPCQVRVRFRRECPSLPVTMFTSVLQFTGQGSFRTALTAREAFKISFAFALSETTLVAYMACVVMTALLQSLRRR